MNEIKVGGWMQCVWWIVFVIFGLGLGLGLVLVFLCFSFLLSTPIRDRYGDQG
jgi:hypothetical protein